MSQPRIKHNRISIKADPRRMSLTSKHRRIASSFQNQGQFEQFLQKLQPAARDQAREILTPYLSFKLAVVQEAV